MCPISEEVSYKYKTMTGQDRISKCIREFPGFKAAEDDHKKDVIKKVKSKHPVYIKCSSWSDDTQDCN